MNEHEINTIEPQGLIQCTQPKSAHGPLFSSSSYSSSLYTETDQVFLLRKDVILNLLKECLIQNMKTINYVILSLGNFNGGWTSPTPLESASDIAD